MTRITAGIVRPVVATEIRTADDVSPCCLADVPGIIPLIVSIVSVEVVVITEVVVIDGIVVTGRIQADAVVAVV